MTPREVVIEALEFRPPPYVPWHWRMTEGCRKRFLRETGMSAAELEGFYADHFLDVGASIGRFDRIDDNHVRDVYGVTWDRTVDRDIGTPCEWPIREPADLARYDWPDPNDEHWYEGIADRLAAGGHLFSRYVIGFSLYERAWAMRGMTALLMDMIERPEFVEEFMDAIVENNLVQIHRALAMGVDCVHFGDDYGMQTGLIMGAERWRHFIKPRLARMFAPVRDAGKYLSMHSCGCVDELFEDWLEIGLNMFNPFQPEVMDIFSLKRAYHGRLAFHGGMSVQKVLPFGSVVEVREMTQRLLDVGREGGYVFSPSHDVPPDVPSENLLAMMEVVKAQAGLS